MRVERKQTEGRLPPNRLVFGTKDHLGSTIRRPVTPSSHTRSIRDGQSAAVSTGETNQLERPAASNMRITSTPPSTRRLPTGKSIGAASCHIRVLSAPPPYQASSVSPTKWEVGDSLKRRAEKAIELRGLLKNPHVGGAAGPLKSYDPNVIKIARRGESFAEQVRVSGSFAKGRRGVRSYERLLGREGSGIGRPGKAYFLDMVDEYKRIRSGSKTPGR